jgi:hypothetical protein
MARETLSCLLPIVNIVLLERSTNKLTTLVTNANKRYLDDDFGHLESYLDGREPALNVIKGKIVAGEDFCAIVQMKSVPRATITFAEFIKRAKESGLDSNKDFQEVCMQLILEILLITTAFQTRQTGFRMNNLQLETIKIVQLGEADNKPRTYSWPKIGSWTVKSQFMPIITDFGDCWYRDCPNDVQLSTAWMKTYAFFMQKGSKDVAAWASNSENYKWYLRTFPLTDLMTLVRSFASHMGGFSKLCLSETYIPLLSWWNYYLRPSDAELIMTPTEEATALTSTLRTTLHIDEMVKIGAYYAMVTNRNTEPLLNFFRQVSSSYAPFEKYVDIGVVIAREHLDIDLIRIIPFHGDDVDRQRLHDRTNRFICMSKLELSQFIINPPKGKE